MHFVCLRRRHGHDIDGLSVRKRIPREKKKKKKERKRKRREEIRFTSRRKGDDAPCIERGYYLRRP